MSRNSRFHLGFLLIALFLSFTPAFAENHDDLGPGLFAVFEIEFTGDKAANGIETFVCALFFEETPLTVANFVALAEGTRRWVDPASGVIRNDPFYDDVIVHRVVEDFVMQAGDPLGTGFGGPGYQFRDEIRPQFSHEEKGMLSMANAGPNTNGSQFFITLDDASDLDGLHTIFGRVVRGIEVVEAIGEAPTPAGEENDDNGGENGDENGNGENDENGEDTPDWPEDRPFDDIVIRGVTIVRNGSEAEAFDPSAQPLPEPRGSPPLDIARSGSAFFLLFEQELFVDYRVHASPDLEAWEFIGNIWRSTETQGFVQLPTNRTAGVSRQFFRVTPVTYPDRPFVGFPDRAFELIIEPGAEDSQVLQLFFGASASDGIYVQNPGTAGEFSGPVEAEEDDPYSGQARLLLLTNLGQTEMILTFEFDDETSGTFSGTSSVTSPPREISGTFTVTAIP